MRTTVAILFSLTLASAAFAQDAAPQPMTAEQRIAMQLGNLAMQNAALGAEVEKDKVQITALQKQIADAKAKPDKKD